VTYPSELEKNSQVKNGTSLMDIAGKGFYSKALINLHIYYYKHDIKIHGSSYMMQIADKFHSRDVKLDYFS